MERNQIEALIKKYGISESGNGQLYVKYPGNDVEIIKAAKVDILAYYTQIKSDQEERASKIKAIDGLDELKSSNREWEDYRYLFNKSMESGNGRFPSKPQSDPEDLTVKYPRAAAYIAAESYTRASNFEKASAGRNALERIINGEDHETVISEMESEWKTAAHEAAMNN